jgi:hypothetical protein
VALSFGSPGSAVEIIRWNSVECSKRSDEGEDKANNWTATPHYKQACKAMTHTVGGAEGGGGECAANSGRHS